MPKRPRLSSDLTIIFFIRFFFLDSDFSERPIFITGSSKLREKFGQSGGEFKLQAKEDTHKLFTKLAPTSAQPFRCRERPVPAAKPAQSGRTTPHAQHAVRHRP